MNSSEEVHLEQSPTTAESKAQIPWSPSSWKQFPIKQQPVYSSSEAVEKALAKVQALPPLVHAREIEQLKTHLAGAAAGRSFLLQVWYSPLDPRNSIIKSILLL